MMLLIITYIKLVLTQVTCYTPEIDQLLEIKFSFTKLYLVIAIHNIKH